MSSNTPAENTSTTVCADEVRAHDFGQYAATLFAQPEQRRALLALHAFNYEISDVRGHITQPLPGEIRLQWWIDALTGAGHGGVEGHPVAAELIKAIKMFDLPVDDLVRLIDAHRFDLYDDPMPTMDALESHLANTDATLFSLAARICAPHVSKTDEAIHHAGLAQGLVRIIGLLPVHAARRQLYLPRQLLNLNAVGDEDIFAAKVTPELRTVLTYLRRAAQTHLDTAHDCLAVLPPELCRAFLPLALVGRTLKRMERLDFDPFRPPQPSSLSILWTLWRASRKVSFRS